MADYWKQQPPFSTISSAPYIQISNFIHASVSHTAASTKTHILHEIGWEGKHVRPVLYNATSEAANVFQGTFSLFSHLSQTQKIPQLHLENICLLQILFKTDNAFAHHTL